MARHLPVLSLQHPRARAHRLERPICALSFNTIVDHGAVLAKRDDLVVAEFVVVPRLEVGALQHLVDGRRRHGGENEVAGKDHDRIARQEGQKLVTGAAKRSPGLVFEAAHRCGKRGVGKCRICCHLDIVGVARSRRRVQVFSLLVLSALARQR